MSNRSMHGILWAASLMATVGTLACRREDTGNQTVNQALAQEKLTAEPNAAGKAAYAEAEFDLSLSAPAKLSHGQAGELVVVLTPKTPFHVNLEYPHRFKVSLKKSLSTPSDTFQRNSAKVTESRMELAIPVTLGEAGPYELEGELSFSVCTNEKCLMEKRVLRFQSKGD
jgi:hypothetical protein